MPVDIKSQQQRALKPDAQAFDEVRIVTVPRYKESEMSGDEWRISAKVQLFRKGRLIIEKQFSNVETACAHAAAVYSSAAGDGHGFFGGEGDFCDQEGCPEKATVIYQKIADYCREGHRHDLGDRIKIRKFCNVHKHRGDCGLDDADSNYMLFAE